MKLYKPLELPLLYETDETKQLEDAGIEVNYDMFVVRTSTLYQISSIGPQYHDSDKTSDKPKYTHSSCKSLRHKGRKLDNKSIVEVVPDS
mgnify:CR=1 FL=1